MSDVKVRIGSTLYEGWKNVAITRDIESLCGTFELDLSDKWAGEPWVFVPNLTVDISIDNDQVMRGLIDQVTVSAQKDRKSLKISGRDQTADLVDCSAMNIPGNWSETDLTSLARQLVSPFNLSVKSLTSTPIKFEFKLQTGESPWEAINRANEFQGALIISDLLGRVVITKPGTTETPVADNLEYGMNLIGAEMGINYSDRFSEYTVKGQTKIKETSGWGSSERDVNFTAKAADPAIAAMRNRPKLFQAEGKATQTAAQNRVNLEASLRAAKSSEFRATVQGWRQTDKQLWPLNQYVYVNFPPGQVFNRKMLIASLTYAKSEESGEITHMVLRRGDAYEKLIKRQVRKGTANNYGW